jgi:hypothetical protein
VLGGNSNNHGVFGVSCYFDQLSVPFAACNKCYEALVPYIGANQFDNPVVDFTCCACYGWSLSKLCQQGSYTDRISDRLKLYPGDFGYHLTLGPGSIDFEQCKQAWTFATTKLIADMEWGNGNTEAYLKLFCMNDSLIGLFIEEAIINVMIREAIAVDSSAFQNEVEKQHWLDMYHADQDLFHKPKHPAIWDLVSIQDFTETPMHLGQGCQKAVLRSTIAYCTLRNKEVEFVTCSTTLLSQLKNVRVDIAAVLTF